MEGIAPGDRRHMADKGSDFEGSNGPVRKLIQLHEFPDFSKDTLNRGNIKSKFLVGNVDAHPSRLAGVVGRRLGHCLAIDVRCVWLEENTQQYGNTSVGREQCEAGWRSSGLLYAS